MGWEKRGKRLYYYRKIRSGKQVVSEYVGAGSCAELISDQDDFRRQLERAKRRQEQTDRKAQRQQERQVRNLARQIRALTAAVLLANGFHSHKGQWRKQA